MRLSKLTYVGNLHLSTFTYIKMAFVRIFRKAKMLQNSHFCEISARQKSVKSTNIYQKTRHEISEIT